MSSLQETTGRRLGDDKEEEEKRRKKHTGLQTGNDGAQYRDSSETLKDWVVAIPGTFSVDPNGFLFFTATGEPVRVCFSDSSLH